MPVYNFKTIQPVPSAKVRESRRFAAGSALAPGAPAAATRDPPSRCSRQQLRHAPSPAPVLPPRCFMYGVFER